MIGVLYCTNPECENNNVIRYEDLEEDEAEIFHKLEDAARKSMIPDILISPFQS